MADLSRKEQIPTKNTKNTRGNTRENTRESLKPTRMITHMLDPSTHREIHDPQSTRNDTRGNRFFSVRRS